MFGRAKKPLSPRDTLVLVVLIVARISGCENQKELSLDDQVDHAKEIVRELYDGPVEFRVIATKGKGERLDRPELAEVEAALRDGDVDLMVMEDMGRLVRGVHAIWLFGIAVDSGTHNFYDSRSNPRQIADSYPRWPLS
jgi:hypothetical protein